MDTINTLINIVEDDGQDYSLIIYDYWKLKGDSINFECSIKIILSKYGFKSCEKLEKLIAKHSFVTLINESFKCSTCNNAIKARSRNELKMLYQYKLNCHDCMSKDKNEEAIKIIAEIESFIKYRYNFLFMKIEFNLTYLEKIYLYLITIKCQVNEYGKLNKEIWQDMFITERADKNFLIKSLYEKKVIFNINKDDEIIKIINESSNFFLKNSNVINLEILRNYQKYRYIFLEENTFLNFDLNYESFNHMVDELKNQFDYYELDYLDVKEIREFILEQKIIDAYKLISNIQKYRPIPIEKSIELDCVLVELVEKYNLLVVNSMLNYHADKVASNLYSLEHGERKDRDHYFVNKMFIARITSYLEYCKLNNKAPSHIRGIGQNWSYTSLEYFVSKSIINEGLSWTTFSGDELIHKWLNSEKVTIKPDL